MSYPEIDPIVFSVGPLAVRWYGLMYLIGFLGGYGLAIWRARKPNSPWTEDMISDMLFYVAMGVILGGRVGYVLFYNFPEFLSNPLSLFYIWQGGMSFHGGMLGVFFAMYLFGRKYQRTFFQVTDFMAPMVPLGLGTGRIGNFINAELPGRVTDVPWAMVYPNDTVLRHPSSLYQAVTEGIILGFALWFFSARQRPRYAVSGFFMVGYGCARFSTEFFREPDAHLGFIAFDWLTMGQLLSFPMILIGVYLLYLAYTRRIDDYQLMQPVKANVAKNKKAKV